MELLWLLAGRVLRDVLSGIAMTEGCTSCALEKASFDYWVEGHEGGVS